MKDREKYIIVVEGQLVEVTKCKMIYKKPWITDQSVCTSEEVFA